MLVVPSTWPEGESHIAESDVTVVELPVNRAGDVNRHRYEHPAELGRVVRQVDPDVLDIHEEPFSVASSQWLKASPKHLPAVMYTAQNVDKRLPPPFYAYEQRAYKRTSALYPCSRQAASVARGKGFTGIIEVLPLGYDPAVYYPGRQSRNDEITLGLLGALCQKKVATTPYKCSPI